MYKQQFQIPYFLLPNTYLSIMCLNNQYAYAARLYLGLTIITNNDELQAQLALSKQVISVARCAKYVHMFLVHSVVNALNQTGIKN